jgi:hypothetical protein
MVQHVRESNEIWADDGADISTSKLTPGRGSQSPSDVTSLIAAALAFTGPALIVAILARYILADCGR